MDDKPHVGFVNPHAKGNRRHHNLYVITLEGFLHTGTLTCAQPGMVSRRSKMGFAQLLAHLLHALSAVAVNNSALAFQPVRN